MPRSAPMTMTFPPFEGTVRRLILANIAVFFAYLILSWLMPGFAAYLVDHLLLEPYAMVRGQIWQLLTYCFLNLSLLGIVIGMLTIWFLGPMLEGAYGSRWMAELYFSSAIGGALLASLISFTRILHLTPQVQAGGVGAAILGLLIAIAARFGDQEFFLWFLIRIKAKYLVTIYILIDVAVLLKNSNEFGALLDLSGALCGYLFVAFAPRRGLAYGVSEQYFNLRNGYYRAKRRRAARKFEVYMSKQGRQVHFDKDGRYLDPDEARKDPNDKRWMN